MQLGPNGTLQFGIVPVSFYIEGHEPKVEVAPQAKWQQIRIKDPQVNLPLRKPPLLGLSMNKAPTLVQTRQRGDILQTIISIPSGGGQISPATAAEVTQVPYVPPAAPARYVPPTVEVPYLPPVPPSRAGQQMPETMFGRPPLNDYLSSRTPPSWSMR